MRTLIVSAGAVLSALVLAAGALATDTGNDTSTDDGGSFDDTTKTATHDDFQQKLASFTDDAEDGGDDEADEATVKTDDDAADAVDADDATEPFGEVRSAQVQAAVAAGEKPGPAWQLPEHPTGGPEEVAAESEDADDQGEDADDQGDDADDQGDDDDEDSDDDDDGEGAAKSSEHRRDHDS